MSDNSSGRFATRLGLILSVLGIAVGTGNIWRFPRIAAMNGGEEGAGAFLLAWVVFLLVWSVPLIIAEYALGRKGRMGVVGTFAKIAGERRGWMGGFVGFVATAIMFYYAVVAGWCVFYFVEMLINPLPLTPEAAEGVWESFQAGGTPLFFHALAMGVGVLAIWKGVESIERINMVLIPTLLAIVIIALLRAVTLEGAWEGVAFLFTPQWDTLAEPQLWLEALTQNAWDTGAGWGLILTYGAYMQYRHGTVKNAFITGVGNNIVSLMAAITIFGIVFAVLGAQMSQGEVLEVMQTSGPAATGLTFIWMPQLFAEIPFGTTLATLFFLGLAFAAFSSLISMIELATRVFVDFGLPRAKAALGVGVVGFLMGIPSAVNLDVFANQDFVWGVGLIISGALVAYAVIRYGVRRFREEEVDATTGDWNVGRTWEWIIGVLVPIQAVVLLGWWLYQSAAVEMWYDPFEPFSVMTVLVQWGAVAIVLYLLNRWMIDRTLYRPVQDVSQ